MRVSHLYTGLFLAPWMAVYAVSAFCLNHGSWFTDHLKLAPKWVTVRQAVYTADATFPKVPEEQAVVLLRHLGLEGPHNIMGAPTANQLAIWRVCVTGNYRITWQRQNSRLLVEQQQPASFYSFVNNLHFMRGYPHPYLAMRVWAVIVDIVTVSTLVWVISGIWLWARKPRERRLGTLCLASGCLLFAALAVLLSR